MKKQICKCEKCGYEFPNFIPNTEEDKRELRKEVDRRQMRPFSPICPKRGCGGRVVCR